MTDLDKVWPPAPDPTAARLAADVNIDQAAVKFCPNCGRKLLTQTSALCNWCGVKIEDPEYQQRATQTRLERDAAERAAIEAVIAEEAQHGVLGRLKRRAKAKPDELKP